MEIVAMYHHGGGVLIERDELGCLDCSVWTRMETLAVSFSLGLAIQKNE